MHVPLIHKLREQGDNDQNDRIHGQTPDSPVDAPELRDDTEHDPEIEQLAHEETTDRPGICCPRPQNLATANGFILFS
jgi:hypothetical protein